MNLYEIKDPSFLKNLSNKECQNLAEEIRSFLIESISKTGGHLASNLGVVELSIALHKSFDSPKDKIFFDVGHQSYTHKILTGRINDFPKLRQYKGLSGFEKFSESKHDVWEAGHSSTSLSAALGMAIARDLNKDDYFVVPVIGDGALGSGMALEALNEIGSEKRNMIIIFNDNDMSISNNVGALSFGFAKLRTTTTYKNFKTELKHNLSKSKVGNSLLNTMISVRDSLKDKVIDSGIFGEFGLDYLGPIDGHNINDICKAIDIAKTHKGPIVIHVITKKGKGYKYAEKDVSGYWHGVGPFDIDSGEPIYGNDGDLVDNSLIMSDALYELALENKDIVALTPAMITGSKLEKFFAKFSDRSFDTGIAEQHATTLAASLALSKKRPYLAIYSSFMQRAYDQINHDVCRMDLPVVFGIDRAGLVGADGDTHHGIFDISYLRALPNMIIAEGVDSREQRNLLYTAFSQNHPFGIRIAKGYSKVYNGEFEKIEIGTWTIYNHSINNDIIVFTYGEDVYNILNKAISNNKKVTVVNCRFFKPIDNNMLEQLYKENKKMIVYETDIKIGGLASAILEWANDNNLNNKLYRFGIDDRYVGQGSNSLLKKECKIDLDTLFELIESLEE